MFRIIQRKKIWFSLSGLLVVMSILALLFWGLNLGLDFTGGSLMELKFSVQRPTNAQIQEALADLESSGLYIQPVDEDGVLIRTFSLTEEQHQAILQKLDQLNAPAAEAAEAESDASSAEALNFEGQGLEGLQIEAIGENNEVMPFELNPPTAGSYQTFEELRFDSIGPVIGQELQQKAIYAIIIVLLAIIAYIAYAFKKVSHPVESWKYGLSAILALVHDILIIIGVFAVLGHWLKIQVDAYFVTALLTVLGFSVHDTIVTFDRIRENLKRHQDKTFEEVVNLSVNETMVRSLNTSLTTIFALLAIILFGGQTIKYFALALMLGAVVGTYSSIFLASPLLMVWYKFKKY
ncbi:MAG TPA: protein translocase subunit SecF [Patescibacteria group bacterium]|nr:protein translocase subunit SecF [Patescibacteria group bacterium]